MKQFSKKYTFLIICICFISSANAQRVITSFDADWKFIKQDISQAAAANYNDKAWRSLNVPHDWSIEYPFNRANTSGRGGGYVETGIGWYRKSFVLNTTESNQQFFIEFDGVMMNSDVWINGYHLGKRPYGYISFQYELTKHLNFGKDKVNVIAVRADNSLQPASRWYTGSGIYRHVKLISTGNTHIDKWGVFVTTPKITTDKAIVHTQIQVLNQSAANNNIVIETSIIAPNGTTVSNNQLKLSIAASQQKIVDQDLTVTQPQLWSLEKTNQYTAIVTVKANNKIIDTYKTIFGIRTIQFDAEKGFLLNGNAVKIKGVCLHHDGGAFGSAVPLGVWEKRILALKELGVNGIRTSHNPVAPEFLTLCDQLGMLVMNETFDTWNARKTSADNGYNLYFTDWWERDTRDQVLRDRNHPSVVIYSIGNEIHDNLNDSTGFRKYKMQQDLVHSLDSTRPVTMALFRPGISRVYENGFAETMDIVGQNYRENELVALHEKKPTLKQIGTENRTEQAAWIPFRDKPYIAGQFLWTGIDYIGESDWPAVVHGSGLLDRTGFVRHLGYQRKSWWSDEPMVYTMRKEGNAGAGEWINDWSPTDVDTYDEAKVQVFSNCDEVELFLNDISQGVKPRPTDNASPRGWSFTFHTGVLKTVGKNNGKIVATQVLKTAGAPAKIILSTEKKTVGNTWDDVCYITATIVDENNVECLNADNQIEFNVTGAGVLAGADNGDLTATESFLSNKRFSYKGRCIAIVKANAATGKINIVASTSNLKSANLVIEVSK
ncbi:MAG: glycoside hydrolase family 2 protein [Sediminibacterium sp.]|nr:MAG: glycoside hydrolase family 2 protein [Sediminibacterium sp.]